VPQTQLSYCQYFKIKSNKGDCSDMNGMSGFRRTVAFCIGDLALSKKVIVTYFGQAASSAFK